MTSVWRQTTLFPIIFCFGKVESSLTRGAFNCVWGLYACTMCKRINFEPFAYAFQGHARDDDSLSVFSRGFPGYALTVCRGEPQKAKRFCSPKESQIFVAKQQQISSLFWATRSGIFLLAVFIGITEGNSVKSGDEQRNAHEFHTYRSSRRSGV